MTRTRAARGFCLASRTGVPEMVAERSSGRSCVISSAISNRHLDMVDLSRISRTHRIPSVIPNGRQVTIHATARREGSHASVQGSMRSLGAGCAGRGCRRRLGMTVDVARL